MVFVNLDSPTNVSPGAVVVGLLEPKRIEIMQKVLAFNATIYGAVRQTVLMTDVTPWLYLGVLIGGPSQSLLDAMKENRSARSRA